MTDRDAKALGQPVGSTTTVLLTAYPGGHNGNAANRIGEGVASTSQDASGGLLSSQANSTGTGNPPNIQVVYSSSHIDSIPGTLASSTTTSVSETVPFSVSTSTNASSIPSSEDMAVSVGNEYLTAAASRELLEATSNISTIPNQGDDGSTDLAAQLINQYTAGVGGDGATGFSMEDSKGEGTHIMGSTSAELAPLEGEQAKTSET